MKKLWTRFGYGITGIILAAVGLGVIWSSNPRSNTASAVTSTYSSNWKATRLYRLNVTDNIQRTDPVNAIGVYKWAVTGNMGSSTFTETWTGPSPNSISFNSETTNGTKCNTNGYDKTKWLAGCLNGIGNADGRWRFTLDDVDPNSTFYSGRYDPPGDDERWFEGGAVNCIGLGSTPPVPSVSSGCYFTSGAYSTFRSGNQGEKTPAHALLMMPLEWNVEGELTTQ